MKSIDRLQASLTTTSYRQPDTAYSWLVLGCAFLIIWLTGGMGFCFGIVLPVFIREFEESRQNGALVGSLMIGTLLGQSLITSQLCQRYSCRLLSAIGHALCAAGYLLSSTALSVFPLFFTYSVLVGTGMSFIIIASFLIAEQYFKKRRALAIGIISAGVGVGIMTWGPLSQQIINRLGWRSLFRLIAGLYCAFTFLTIPFDPKVGKRPEEGASANTRQQGFCKILMNVSVWRYRPFTVSVISICTASLGHYAVIIHLVKYAEELGIPATKSSTLYIASGIATVIARVVAGRICDLACVRPMYVNLSAEVASGIVTFCCPLATSFTHLVVLITCYGLADGFFRSTINLLFMQTKEPDPVKVASAFGSANMATAIPTAAGPALAGLMADRFGSYHIAFFVCGGITLSSALIYVVPEIYIYTSKKLSKRRQARPPISTHVNEVFDNPTCTYIQDTPL